MQFLNFLRIAVVPLANIFVVNRTNSDRIEVTGGIEKEFMELFAKKLEFDYEVLVPNSGAWGVEHRNGTWDGVIGMLQHGQADIAFGQIFIKEQSKMVVDFSPVYDISEITFATSIPGLLPKTKAILMPFQSSIWWCLIAISIIYLLTLRLVQRNDNSFSGVTLKILGYIFQQPVNIPSKEASASLLLITWILMVRYIPLIYSSALLSFLTLPVQESGVKNIQDLTNRVMKGTYKVVLQRGTTYLVSMENSTQSGVKSIAEKILQNNWFIDNNPEAIKEALEAGKTAVIASKSGFERRVQNIFISQDTFFTKNVAIAIRTGFCCPGFINRFVLRVFETGIYKKIVDDYFNEKQVFEKSGETLILESQSKPLKIEDLSGTFILLLVGYVIAASVCLAEIVSRKLQTKFK